MRRNKLHTKRGGQRRGVAEGMGRADPSVMKAPRRPPMNNMHDHMAHSACTPFVRKASLGENVRNVMAWRSNEPYIADE